MCSLTTAASPIFAASMYLAFNVLRQQLRWSQFQHLGMEKSYIIHHDNSSQIPTTFDDRQRLLSLFELLAYLLPKYLLSVVLSAFVDNNKAKISSDHYKTMFDC
ncbi:hypothetical protein BD770DRAFT_407579 [Pilaira anomala]|nr:hypothetical protein BD770DRAFT_407579 [Pilaira anomala]